MSAGGMIALPAGLAVNHAITCLAPKMQGAVTGALADCRGAGLDAIVWESCRSQELQELYWHRGRPPSLEFPRPVTWQRDARKSWHFYGLAVDVISERHQWFQITPALTAGLSELAVAQLRVEMNRQRVAWFTAVAEIFAAHGCAWGGHWQKRDDPHFQWGPCRPTPSILSINAVAQGGREAVWALVRAA